MSIKLSLLLISVAFTGVVSAEVTPAPAPAPMPAPAAEPAPAVEAEGKTNELNEHSSLKAVLKHLDANKDGALQATEIAGVKSEPIKAKLVALDSSKDGTVDATEIEAGKKAWKEKHEKEHGEKKK